MTAYLEQGADLSPCSRYRWRLWRRWDELGDTVAFVALNPSTADGETDDPTLAKLVRYGRAWGYGALVLVNLYPWRATDPRDLWKAEDAGEDVEGDVSGIYLALDAAEDSRLVVACWGAAERAQARGDQMARALLDVGSVHCFTTTKSGAPGHPLYLPGDLTPTPWNLAP